MGLVNLGTPFEQGKGSNDMSTKVTFDYGKTSPFISAGEIEKIKKQTLDAKEVLLSKAVQATTF